MEYTEIMVRYGELSTKGKNRKDFIARLGGNIRKSLKDFEQVVVHPNRDRNQYRYDEPGTRRIHFRKLSRKSG